MADPTRTADSFVFKTDRPWPNPLLTVAATVGHSTPTSARLWLRTEKTGEFTLLFPQEEIADEVARADPRERLGQVPMSLGDLEASVTVVGCAATRNSQRRSIRVSTAELPDRSPQGKRVMTARKVPAVRTASLHSLR